MSKVTHTLRYSWPVIIGLGSFVAAAIFATKENFRYTHGFYEIAIIVSLLGAIAYGVKLAPQKGKNGSLPWFINCGYLSMLAMMALIGILSTWLN